MSETVEYHETVALRALIEQDPRLTGRVGVGSAIVPGHEGDDSPPVLDVPYVVIYGDGDDESSQTVTGSAEWNRDPGWSVHAVSDTELGAIAVLGWVDSVLRPQGRGVIPAVPGRRTGRVRRTERPGNALDDDATPHVWAAIAVYHFRSDRTTPTT